MRYFNNRYLNKSECIQVIMSPQIFTFWNYCILNETQEQTIKETIVVEEWKLISK